MWAAYRDSGLGHFVPFWTRYLPVFARTKEIVDSGVLGDVRGVVCRWQNPRPESMPFTWRDDASMSSSGSIGDLGSPRLRHGAVAAGAGGRPRDSPRRGHHPSEA